MGVNGNFIKALFFILSVVRFVTICQRSESSESIRVLYACTQVCSERSMRFAMQVKLYQIRWSSIGECQPCQVVFRYGDAETDL